AAGGYVDEDQVVVGAAGDQPDAAAQEPVGEGGGVVNDALGVVAEAGGAGFGQGDGLGGHHVGQRAAQYHRAALVDVLGELVVAQDHPAPGAAQRLVCGAIDDVGVWHGVEVAGEDFPGDQAGEVRHVDQQGRAGLVGDVPHEREVDPPGVGGVAAYQDQRPELAGGGAQGVVGEQAGGRVGAVAALLEHLAGDVGPDPVGEVATGVEGHAEYPLPAQLVAQDGPVVFAEVVDVAGLRAAQCRCLDPLGEDCPERDQVGVDAGVRLQVGVRGAEQGAGVLGGDGLDRVDLLAAGVEPVPDGALGVLVAEPVPHGQQRGGGGVVLARDELEGAALGGQLAGDRFGDARLGGPHNVQSCAEGY